MSASPSNASSSDQSDGGVLLYPPPQIPSRPSNNEPSSSSGGVSRGQMVLQSGKPDAPATRQPRHLACPTPNNSYAGGSYGSSSSPDLTLRRTRSPVPSYRLSVPKAVSAGVGAQSRPSSSSHGNYTASTSDRAMEELNNALGGINPASHPDQQVSKYPFVVATYPYKLTRVPSPPSSTFASLTSESRASSRLSISTESFRNASSSN